MTAKKKKVKFLAHVTHGFKTDTPGFEAGVDKDGKPDPTVQAFEEGEEFEVPENEADEFEKLVDLGYAAYLD